MQTLMRPLAQGNRRKSQWVAIFLLLFVTTASAVSIGRLRGAAWLGQPMDLSVAVQADPGESAASFCFEAEVFHGDVRQESGRVRVTSPSAQANGSALQVRIQSLAPVDEPVVTVHLRETCVAKVARRFVLLAELLPEPLAPAVPVLPQAAAPALPGPVQVMPVPERSALSASVTVPATAEPKASPTPPPAKPRPRRAPPAASEDQKPAPAPKPQVAKPTPAPAPAKPTLKLDPVETLRERVMQLEAAAAQAPASATPEEVRRLQKLEQNLESLLALSAKNERSLAEMREKLRQAESEKYDNTLVYALAALLLASLGGMIALWLRQRRLDASKDWWQGSAGSPPSSPPSPSQQPTGLKVAAAASSLAAITTSQASGKPATPPVGASASVAAAAAPDVDLDDLLGAEENMNHATLAKPGRQGSPENRMSSDLAHTETAAYKPSPATDAAAQTDFPPLTSAQSAHAPSEDAADAASGASALSDFPAAAEVTLDLSHLSLTPAEPPAQAPESASPSASLLDFDLPGLENPQSDKKA